MPFEAQGQQIKVSIITSCFFNSINCGERLHFFPDPQSCVNCLFLTQLSCKYPCLHHCLHHPTPTGGSFYEYMIRTSQSGAVVPEETPPMGNFSTLWVVWLPFLPDSYLPTLIAMWKLLIPTLLIPITLTHFFPSEMDDLPLLPIATSESIVAIHHSKAP
jgi:hypothetical protein